MCSACDKTLGDIEDRLRRPLVSHAAPEQLPDRELARKLVDDRSDALVEIVRLRGKIIAALDCLHHDDPAGARRILARDP